MHTPLLTNRFSRWLAVALLALLSSTAAQAQTLINETFESTSSFTLVNGTQVNKWFVGTVAGNGPTTTGTNAAYISDDAAGATYNYTLTTTSVTHLYRDVVIPAGQSINTLAFDWKAGGESTYDYLQVFVVPNTVTPVAGTQLAGGTAGAVQLGGNINLQAAYGRTTLSLPASVAGTTQRLVFTWRNDASGGVQPPVALDNITLTSAAPVPVCGTKSVGPTGDYASLTAAFSAINVNGVCGATVLELQASYVSTTETFPLLYTYAGTTATNTVTVRPAAGATGLSITGTGATAVMNIFGGKYLIIDGRPGGSGSTVSGAAQATDLTIASTNVSGIPMQFTSDATFNTVQHTQIVGVGNNVSSYPNVNFTGTTTTLGNSDNTFQYNNVTAGATTPVSLLYSGSSLNSRNSIIGNNFSNFYLSGGSAYGININTAGTGWVISGNSVYQTASRASTAGTLYGINIVGGNGYTITNNFIGGTAPNAGGTPLTATGTAAAFRFSGIFLTLSGAVSSVQGNTIANINWLSSSGATTTYGIVSGIYISAGDANIGTTTGNTVGTAAGPISVNTSTTGGYSFGISSASSGTVNISGNTISNITGVGSSATVASNVAGILVSAGTTNTISRNKLYTLVSGSGVAAISTGIWLTGGTTNNVSNNLIGDLQAPASTSLAAVTGLLVAGGTTNNVAFNTIRLDGTSTGATFGTQGIYLNSLTAGLNLFNNLVVNLSVPVGTGGVATAIRRISGTAGTVPSNLFGNNNLYYAGTPSATNLIYVEGTTTATNAIQTLAAYKAFLLNREANSVTETSTPFASTTGSAANFLHLTAGAATQAESAGQPFNGITTDFDGDTRNATTPDIGADEGSFLLLDQTGPLITVTSLTGSQGSAGTRILTVSITDASGIATGTSAPRLYFRKGTSGAFVAAAAPTVAGSVYTFTFDYSLVGGVVAGDVINYYVAAQDALGNVSTNPTGGTGATPPGTTGPAVVYTYTILGSLSGTYYVSATSATSPVPARTYATLTAAVAAYNTSALGGAVTFLLLDPTYSTAETFPIAVLNNVDASATNTLLIKPSNATGTTAFAITGSNATAILQLLASDYVTIDGTLGNTISATDLRPSRDLTITNTSTGTSSAVVQQFAQFTNDGATFNTIKNLVAVGTATGTTGTLYGIQLSGVSNATAANQYTNNTVQNCAVRATQVGIASLGGAIGLKNQNVIITQNDLNATGTSALTKSGIVALFDNNGQFTQNTIGNIPTGSFKTSGILLGFGIAGFSNTTFTGSEVTNALVSRNSIGAITNSSTYSAIGIGVATATTGTNTIVNNFVSGVIANGTGSDFGAGIFVNGSAGGGTTRVLYNSVSMTGTVTGASQPGFALAVGGSSPTLEIRNNVFYNSQSTGNTSYAIGFAYAGTTGNYAGLTSTNNAFAGTTGVGLTGSLGTSGTARTALADLNTETGQDRPTTATAPVGTSIALTSSPFNSTTDLHSISAVLNNAGVPVTGITTDFDGETRSTTTPDIGGDEFTPPSCLPVTGLTFASITSTSASITFTAPASGATSYTITYTPAGGTATTITPAPTTSPVALPILTPSTTYTVTVTTNCTGGSTSPSATGTFTTLCSPPVYATLPVTESFENTWISRCDTREVPTANWLNTPTTGNPSWRRDDDGAAANWTSPTLGAYTPAGSQGSSHSARFHSYYASSGAVGTFDLYANLSAAGPKRLTFDYVNVSTAGSKIEILLSTDGGATFSTTPLLTINTAATFTAQTLDLTATSATSVIRFKATSDFGSYDIGVDNVQLRTLPAIDLAPTALATPTSTQGCYGAAETVAVTVTNQGAQALNFATSPATVTAVVTTPSGPQTLTGSISTGTLAAGATQNVTLTPTLNMTAVGAYSFAITATVTGDGNTANDALAPVVRTVAAPVAGTLAPATTSICISGTASLTLTGAANGSIQYQSSPDNVTFTDITGATSAAYTTPVLTSTTYYRAQVRCNSGVATSNVSTITVNNPLVATTNTPVAICAGSTATLTATASTGSSVRFFSTATGGTALTSTTAGSYTTPALTASTTYYAEAFTGGQENTGKASTTGSDGANTSGGLYFTTTGATTIVNVTVYRVANAAAGTATIYLLPGSTTTTTGALATATVTVPANTTAAVSPTVLSLNFAVPAAGSYTLYIGASTPSLIRDTSGGTATPATAFPYTSPSGAVSITGGTLAGYYYFFYNWQIGSECASAARTAVQVNVTQPATASFPAATAATCGASAYALGGTVGGSVTTGTYTSSGTGTFAPNATTLNATYTPSAADIAAGSVTITLTSAIPTACTAATATLALSISPAPVATFSYGTGTPTFCVSGTNPTVTLGTGATAGTFTSTTGLTINATTGAITLSSSTPGTYTVTNSVAASGACAAATATATVTITAAPIANAGPAVSFCSGASAQLGTTAVAGTTYTWTPSTGLSNASVSNPTVTLPNTTGTPITQVYTLTATSAGSCTAISTVVVTVNPLPATPTYTYTYPTTGTVLFTSSVAPAGTTYQWYLGGVAITGATSQTYTANGATAPGIYTVRFISTATGCQSAASTPLTVTATGQPLAGSSLTLFPNPTATGEVTLQLSGYTKAVQLTVLDALGRVVLTQKVAAGQVQAQLDLSGSASGVYLLRATTDGGTDVRRIVRE